jgi:hypothetical protein
VLTHPTGDGATSLEATVIDIASAFVNSFVRSLRARAESFQDDRLRPRLLTADFCEMLIDTLLLIR